MVRFGEKGGVYLRLLFLVSGLLFCHGRNSKIDNCQVSDYIFL
jgi:hypothetical protein